MRRNGIHREHIVADAMQHDPSNTISLAVWDVPMPVIAGDKFSIKIGAKSASGRALAGCRVAVSDSTGAVVATGTLGDKPWPDTEALYWIALDVRVPAEQQFAEYAVRFMLDSDEPALESVATRFSVAATAKPEHKLIVKVTEQTTAAALEGVEIRLGAFRARTNAAGRAELRVCKGEYQLQLCRTAHIASPKPLKIDGDASVELTMVHVPEDHPDARWVR
jgi:hypothetical protein